MTTIIIRAEDELLLLHEVARAFRVAPKTISRWAAAGKFPEGTVLCTPGGQRRYRAATIRRMLNEGAA